MPIRFRCDHCRQRLSITRRKAGREVQCPACGETITVPELAEGKEPRAEGREEEASAPEPTASPSVPMSGHRLGGEEASGAPADSAASPKSSALSAPPPSASDEDDEGVVIRRPETEFEEMDLTPMVDVTFLLLIFFMITASFSLQKSIEVPEPDPEKKGAAQSIQRIDDLLDESLRIDIDGSNRVSVDDQPVAEIETLEEVIRQRSQSERKGEVVLTADAAAYWETTITVIDACNAAGIQRIRLASSAE